MGHPLQLIQTIEFQDFFQNQLLNAIEVTCYDETAFVVDDSLLSLNEPNNLFGVTNHRSLICC